MGGRAEALMLDVVWHICLYILKVCGYVGGHGDGSDVIGSDINSDDDVGEVMDCDVCCRVGGHVDGVIGYRSGSNGGVCIIEGVQLELRGSN